MNFLGNIFLHVSHGLVVRILASGAGGPGSNPGGVPSGIEEDRLWKLWVMDDVTKCVKWSEFLQLFAAKNVI